MTPACPICEGRELEPGPAPCGDWEYGVPGSFEFKRCRACGLMVLSPMPTPGELKSYYPPDYHGFHTAQGGIISFLYRMVYASRFKEYVNLMGERGRLLDVGCADAPYFDPLKERYPGMNLTGVEFKDEIAEMGRKKGRNIITGDIRDIPPSEKYDLIVMNNLIEHVLSPLDELKKAGGHLNSGGRILIETPNIASWDFHLAGRFWGGLHVPRHTHLFSPASIKALASEAGLDVVGTEFLLNTDHWALSVQNFLQSTKRFSFRAKKGRVWYYKYLLFAFIPLNFVQKIFKKTGAFKAVLRKP